MSLWNTRGATGLSINGGRIGMASVLFPLSAFAISAEVGGTEFPMSGYTVLGQYHGFEVNLKERARDK